MIEGSSTQEDVVSQVYAIAEKFSNVLVLLDSNHTHSHVLDELRTYSPLVSRGSYCVVFDTIIDQFPDDMYPDRPWGPNNSPKSAIDAFLSENKDFVIDEQSHERWKHHLKPGDCYQKIINGRHFFPFEKWDETATMIKSFIKMVPDEKHNLIPDCYKNLSISKITHD